MMNLELLKYVFYGLSILVGMTTFSLADDLRNPKFFKISLYAGIVLFVFGFIFEITDLFSTHRGLTIVIMSNTIIYLGCYTLLRKIFRKWKKTDPYITSASSTVGEQPIDGFWTKYPKGRKIMGTDFLFSFLQALVPIFLIIILLFLILT